MDSGVYGAGRRNPARPAGALLVEKSVGRAAGGVEQDGFSSNRDLALILFEHDPFGKPLHSFPDHALAGPFPFMPTGLDFDGDMAQPVQTAQPALVVGGWQRIVGYQ